MGAVHIVPNEVGPQRHDLVRQGVGVVAGEDGRSGRRSERSSEIGSCLSVARHAPVFFGRAGDIRRATDLWRERAAKGAPPAKRNTNTSGNSPPASRFSIALRSSQAVALG